MTTSLDYNTRPCLGMNTVPNCSSPCLNGTGEPEETNLPVPPLSLRLDSPAYSVYSDGEYCNTYVDSASSVDGSSRPGSDRFHLGGEFSSFESDAFVSATSSDSSECEGKVSGPLLRLKSLNKRQVKPKSTEIQPILISDSSDEEAPPLATPLNSSHTLKPLSLSIDSNLTLLVRIPLNLITLNCRSTNTNTTIARTKRPPIKLALSHFASSRKKIRQSSSSEDFVSAETCPIEIPCPMETPPHPTPATPHPTPETPHLVETRHPSPETSHPAETPRTPLSLKLKKSALSNQWHPVIDTIADDPPQKRLDTSGESLNKNEQSPCLNSSLMFESNGTNGGSIDDGVLERPASVLTATNDSNSSHRSSEPFSSSDVFLSSAEERRNDDDEDSLSIFSQSTSTSTSESIFGKKIKKPLKSPKVPVITKQAKNGYMNQMFSFEKIFSSITPELTVVNDELQPVQSLSVKDLVAIPADHPIHSWKVGRPVGSRQRKRRKRTVIEKTS